MKRSGWSLAVVTASSILSACAASQAVPTTTTTTANACGIGELAVIDVIIIAENAMGDGMRIGGLSGIDYNASTGAIIMISDDRGPYGGPRAYRATLQWTAQGASLSEIDVTPLDVSQSTDAESVRFTGDGAFLWTAEGDQGLGLPSALFRTDQASNKTQMLAREPVMPRNNRAFEGLSIAPNGTAWLGMENAPEGVGAMPTVTVGADTVLLAMASDGSVARTLAYPLDPIARQYPGLAADNGLSEIVALGDDRFLVLERSGAEQPDGSYVFTNRLYCAFPQQVQGGRLSKIRLAQFNDMGAFETMNFEGLSFGPTLIDGRRTLLLLEDNNFAHPTTALLLLLVGE